MVPHREHFGEMAADLAARVKAMLVPLEDCCRYREQRSEDLASFDVTPRDKQALAFRTAIAPGGVNIETALFTIVELPLTEAALATEIFDAVLAGRVRRVQRLSRGGRLIATKTYVFGGAGHPLYKRRVQAGVLAGFLRPGTSVRERFRPYRS
jgi:hypothetical protein